MLDDGHAVGQVVVSVRLTDVDGQADGLGELLYRWSASDGRSDKLVKMADKQADNADSLMDGVRWHTDGQTLTYSLMDRSQD